MIVSRRGRAMPRRRHPLKTCRVVPTDSLPGFDKMCLRYARIKMGSVRASSHTDRNSADSSGETQALTSRLCSRFPNAASVAAWRITPLQSEHADFKSGSSWVHKSSRMFFHHLSVVCVDAPLHEVHDQAFIQIWAPRGVPNLHV